MRPSGRDKQQLRPIDFQLAYTKYAAGSVLVSSGDTKILCHASLQKGVPKFLKGKKQGWLTAEYSMLPSSTHERCQRDATRGRPDGRAQEIQRLIGRSLRSMIDLRQIGENTIYIDCDVIQADGGTRTAAINGACVALVEAIRFMQRNKIINTDPLLQLIAAVSVGIYQGEPVLDLDYAEDQQADTDMNVVMNHNGNFIEIQGTAEKQAFTYAQQQEMLALAQQGIDQIIQHQQSILR
ncbi:MAG: ribonuclease PH [Pseudomonadota bacterium]